MTNTTETSPRVYVTTDPTAEIKAFANTSVLKPYIGIEGSYYPTSRDMLHVSYDGTVFNTVLYNSKMSGGGSNSGSITQPALGIDNQSITFTDDVVTYGDVDYVLDVTATVGEIITKPIMRIVELVETHSGWYVTTQNLLTGKSYDYLNGQLLVQLSGIRARGGDFVAYASYEGHSYYVTGDRLDMRNQEAVFDNQPATMVFDPTEKFDFSFSDDLSTVKVTVKIDKK